jgi:hypothetical protein
MKEAAALFGSFFGGMALVAFGYWIAALFSALVG